MCDSFFEPLLIPAIGQSPQSAIAHFIVSKGFLLWPAIFYLHFLSHFTEGTCNDLKVAFNSQNDTLPLFPCCRPSAKACILLVNINQRV